jgi:predicted nucleic acid-binding protein
VALKKLRLDAGTLLKVVRMTQAKTRVVTFDIHTIEQAIALQSRYKLQYYDSLILATALESGCSILYSEDMHHGLMIENQLQICNPFMA